MSPGGSSCVAGRVQMLDAEAVEDEILAELEAMLHRVAYPDSR